MTSEQKKARALTALTLMSRGDDDLDVMAQLARQYVPGDAIAIKRAFRILLGFDFDWYVVFLVDADMIYILDGQSESGWFVISSDMIDKRRKWKLVT